MPEVVAAPRVLGAPDRILDEATTLLLEQAAAEAYERGCRDGAARAAQAAESCAERVSAAVQSVDAELRRLAAQVDVQLALQIAAAVLDREPADDTAALLRRVEAALAALDDEALTVHVNADDAGSLAEALASPDAAHGAQVRVVTDASVGPGEARVAGRWSRADLTRRGSWDAVRAVLEEQTA